MRNILTVLFITLATQAWAEKYNYVVNGSDEDLCVDQDDCDLDAETRAYITNEVITKGTIISEYTLVHNRDTISTDLVITYRKQVWVCAIKRYSGNSYLVNIGARCVNTNEKNK